MAKEVEDLFGPKSDNRIKGELLVKLKQEAESLVTEKHTSRTYRQNYFRPSQKFW